jgi:hypothetical protein
MSNLPALSATDRYRLKQLVLEQSTVLPAGRVWWCFGRKIVAQGKLADAGKIVTMGRGSNINTLCVSFQDYDAVKEWLR